MLETERKQEHALFGIKEKNIVAPVSSPNVVLPIVTKRKYSKRTGFKMSEGLAHFLFPQFDIKKYRR